MSTEENKALVRRFGQIWGKGSLDTLDELAAPNFSVYYPLLGQTVHGPEAFKQVLSVSGKFEHRQHQALIIWNRHT